MPGTILKILAALVVVLIFLLALIPSVGSRPSPVRIQCLNRNRCMAAALQNYHSEHQRFPKPVSSTSETGYSWRVEILPYLDETLLWEEYDQNQSWNAPLNRQLHDLKRHPFQCPGHPEPGTTSFVALIAKNSPWTRDFPIGIMRPVPIIVEIENPEINWCEPRDMKFAPWAQGSKGLNKIRFHGKVTHVIFSDFSVRQLTRNELETEWSPLLD